jgi:hypothetical protein
MNAPKVQKRRVLPAERNLDIRRRDAVAIDGALTGNGDVLLVHSVEQRLADQPGLFLQ